MDFKSITLTAIAVIAFNSCQKIDPLPPSPLVIKEQKNAVSVSLDTVYKVPSCNTTGDLNVNGLGYSYLSQLTISNDPKYTIYHFEDYTGSETVEIYVKRQNNVKKKFEIIPYDPNFSFKNYHQAMVAIYLPSLGGLYLAKSGSVNLLNNTSMGFCGLNITNDAGTMTRKFDFTY